MATNKSCILLFGSHDLDITAASLEALRKDILSDVDLDWLVESLSSLLQTWQTFNSTHASIVDGCDGAKHLNHLLLWLRRGEYIGSFPPPNIIVTPLVVATQLAQFIAFTKRHGHSLDPDASLSVLLQSSITTAGLCTGLLSAAAVATSMSLEQLQQNGAVAIRLAMVIGAFVDARNSPPWSSFAVGWAADGGGVERLHEIIERHSGDVSTNHAKTFPSHSSLSSSLLLFCFTGLHRCNDRSSSDHTDSTTTRCSRASVRIENLRLYCN